MEYDQSEIRAEISGLKSEIGGLKSETSGLAKKIEKIEDALVVLTRLEVERDHQRENNNLMWGAIRDLQKTQKDIAEQQSKNTWTMGAWSKVVAWFITSGGLGAVLAWWYTKK